MAISLALVPALSPTPLDAKVDPPNYDFSLDQLTPFTPGSSLEKIKTTFGEGEIYEETKDTRVMKYYLRRNRYIFPIFVQFYQGTVLDFYAKLPTYFLHNIYHQSLINRYSQQSRFKKNESEAVYMWDRLKEVGIVYKGNCTIHCFPVYHAMFTKAPPQSLTTYRSLYHRFQGDGTLK